MRNLLLALASVSLTFASTASAAPEDPAARPLVKEFFGAEEWDFDRHDAGWRAIHDCIAKSSKGSLFVTSTGGDPYLQRTLDIPGGGFQCTIRLRAKTAGPGSIYWATDKAPISEGQRAGFPLSHDGEWQERQFTFQVDGRLRELRLDPGTAAGEIEIDWIKLVRIHPHPIVIERIEPSATGVSVTVHNDSPQARTIEIGGKPFNVPNDGRATHSIKFAGEAPLAVVPIDVTSSNEDKQSRTLFIHREEVDQDNAAASWIVREAGNVKLAVARDGSVARIYRDKQLVGALGPIVHVDRRLPKLTARESGEDVLVEGDGIAAKLNLADNVIAVSIQSARPCEGPCVRAIGEMEQGLFAGLEYLERGDRSSSKIDVETSEHLRYAPDRLKVTMPLAAVATNRGSLALAWDDMKLQPVFASPNVYDATGDHLMSLRGTKIDAQIRVGPRFPVKAPPDSPMPGGAATATSADVSVADGTIEAAILWAINRAGFPALPTAPRNAEQQRAFDLKTMTGPLRTKDGWGHCIEPHWGRAPFADMASTLWRLSGEAPELPNLVPGGAHVRNDSIYFVTGRAGEWLAHARGEIRNHIAAAKSDASYRYDGKYRRGHFEDTASGLCATHAARLLELAYLTGDAEALAAGRRTLEYMKRFRVPRGAQTWEVPLHTPDQLASANLVWAYVRGFELTGDRTYLAEARRWALSGVPFTYLWGDRPVMAYSTIAVYGATNWTEPCWIGLPVQWVGGVYAYSLGLLAQHDRTLDWSHLARGILIAAWQMQYPDGPNAGTLPDSFALADQQRRPWNINPCALVSLQRLLDGQVDSLAVAAMDKRRVTAPFPVRIAEGKALVTAKIGTKYQIVVDGREVIDITSRGDDEINLPPAK